MRRFIFVALALITAASAWSQVNIRGETGNLCSSKVTETGRPMGSAGGKAFQIDDPMNRNVVSFKSSAPLEDILGLSSQISGQLVFDPEHPEKGGTGELSIPVKSLSTGIPLRDEHLAGPDWLDAARYPTISFKINGTRDIRKTASTADAQTYDVTVIGDLSLHGVTKRLEVPARVTFLAESEMTKQKLPGDLLAARTEFTVRLADFGIRGPTGMPLIGSKVGEQVDIQLSVVGSSQSPTMAENPCGAKKAMHSSGNKAGESMTGAGDPCGEKSTGNVSNACSVTQSRSL